MDFLDESDLRAAAAASVNFLGGVVRTEIFSSKAAGGLRAHRFMYPPGGRSRWHTHEGEQVIFVLAGRGIVQCWGEPEGRFVGPGAWVRIKPGERHWHGAVVDDVLLHIAITGGGGTVWHEPVDIDLYMSAHPAQSGGGMDT